MIVGDGSVAVTEARRTGTTEGIDQLADRDLSSRGAVEVVEVHGVGGVRLGDTCGDNAS